MRTPREKRRQGRHRSLDSVVYCLVVLAVFLIALAAWMRYSRRRRPGESPSEPGDAIERRIDAFTPNFGFAEGWIKAGGLPQDSFPRSRFVCPQCQSSCWTHPRRGCPACPFCGRVMARRGPWSSPVGGAAAGGAARGEPKALWRGVAAPAIARDTFGPLLIREFGIEVSPAPGAGAKVTVVMGNSYASNAGLRAGDVIIECNGAKVGGVEEFQQLVSRAPPETDAQITVLRNGRTRDLLVMVGEGEMEGFTAIQRP